MIDSSRRALPAWLPRRARSAFRRLLGVSRWRCLGTLLITLAAGLPAASFCQSRLATPDRRDDCRRGRLMRALDFTAPRPSRRVCRRDEKPREPAIAAPQSHAATIFLVAALAYAATDYGSGQRSPAAPFSFAPAPLLPGSPADIFSLSAADIAVAID